LQKATKRRQLLLDDLTKLLQRFVVLPQHAAETLALWGGTHILQHLPFLSIVFVFPG